MRVALSTFLIASLLKRGGRKEGRKGASGGGCGCGLTCAPCLLGLCVCATFGQVENAKRHAGEKEKEVEEVVGT